MAVTGIDVSSHNGRIDWDRVKNSGIKFAMLRMGYGGNHDVQDDKTFLENVAGCERVGIPWGAYLYSYALNADAARDEVQHALRLLDGKKPTYPIAFDMEDADRYKLNHGNPTNTELVAICKTFLEMMENAGYYVSLYASLSWHVNKLNDRKLDVYDKWVAQWNTKCTYTKNYGMWQYTERGHVDGINGWVDMNTAYKDYPTIIKNQGLNGWTNDTKKPLMYTIKPGDTLIDIAREYNTTYQKLAQLNNIKNPNVIYAGQKIRIR